VLASRRLRVVVATLTALGLSAGAILGWAWLMQDRSAVARAMIWLDAGVDDRLRFEAAPIPAGDDVLFLETGAPPRGVLDEVTLPDGSTTKLDDLLERTETTSFIVLNGDRVWMESYPSGGEREDPVTSFSVAKSILSTVVGLAIERGDIGSLDDAVTDYVPELLNRDERFGRITLRHLMTMSSGLRYEEHGLPWSDDAVTYYSPDLRKTALSAEIEEEPGTRWLYNNYNPLLMGLVLERATGRPLPAYVSEVLWRPLGAEADASWSIDSEASGFAKTESGFNARPMDFARFGYLFAHGGRVGERQVLPEDWVADATAADASTDPAEHYQYWWWVDTEHPGRFMARGNKGQFVYVDPATDVVVVRTGVDFGIEDWPEVLADVVDRVNAAAG
jgi:CubicO group peptidase (beta-lactamase class C family)